MVGAAIIFLQTSCALPQAILLWRGRHILPERPFSLGRFGFAINLISVLWILLLDTLCFFPIEMPVTKENMNYVSVVSIGLTITVFALYLFSKKGKYLGPRLPNEDLGQRECQINEGQELENDADADYRGDMPKKE
jgi:choline transport protein